MPNRKVVMEESKQEKMNALIAKHFDKVIDLSRSQTKVILNNSDRITDINKTIKVYTWYTTCYIDCSYISTCTTLRLV